MYFDIGAHVGKWSLANMATCDEVIAVEASPWTFQQLRDTVKNAPKIKILNYAVCNRNNQDTTFYHAKTNTLSTLNIEWLTNRNSRFCNKTPFVATQCKTITLDTMIEQFGKPQFIKIDVEGAEFDVISSLSQPIPLLCFEWASELREMFMQCIDYLHNVLGYNDFFIQYGDDYTFRPTTFIDYAKVKSEFIKTIPKRDWGMIWARQTI
jgi:FkbM family methyltransferase